MPITARPDPNNPGQYIWVDQATGQPATQPGGAGTPYVAPTDVAAPANIDPNASRPAATAPVQGPPSPGQGTTPSLGYPQGPGGQYTVDQILAGSDQELQQANVQVAEIWDQIRQQQSVLDRAQQAVAGGDVTQQGALTAATSQINTLYTSLSQAEQRVETANAARATTLQKAIDSNQLTPSQVDLAKAQTAKASADADTAKAQAQVLTDGAPGQRALVAAQAGQASAAAAAQQATADATRLKAGPEADQLKAQAN